MGNVPSVEAYRRTPHKLSKPRTGNPTSTAGLLSPDGLANNPGRNPAAGLARRLSFALPPLPTPTTVSSPLEGVVSSEGSSVSRRESVSSAQPTAQPATQQARLQPEQKRGSVRGLFRSRSSQGPPERRERPSRRHSNSIGPASSRAVGETLGRTDSMTYDAASSLYYGGTISENWPPAGSRTSWSYDLTSYEAKRLLNLAEETTAFEQDSIVSENKFTVVSETTWKSSHPTQPGGSTPLSRANSDLSMYTPMRRRSIIQTPGVATRRSSVAEASRPNFRHSHPPTPSMSRQPSFESNASRVLSMPPPQRLADPESIPRVVTPCEGEYKTIGAFKFGSLRITNGAASPAASPEPRRSRTEGKSGRAAGSDTSDCVSAAADSPAGNTGETRPDGVPEPPGSGLKAPKPLLARPSPIATSFAAKSDIASQLTASPTAISAELSASPTQYLADLEFSPFSLEEVAAANQVLQTTSKHTAVEDELFEDDVQLEYSSVEVLDVRIDPNAKSTAADTSTLGTDSTQHSLGSVTRSDSGFVSSPVSEYSQKPLSKADSGYSSNVSLRSLKSSSTKPSLVEREQPQALGSVASPREDSFLIAELRLPSPTILASDVVPASTSTPALAPVPAPPQRAAPPPPPPPPPKGVSPVSPTIAAASIATPKKSPTSEMPDIATLVAPNALKKKGAPAPINSNSTHENGLRSPDATTPISPASAKSDVSASALSIGSGSHRPGKLQRLLSLTGAGQIRGPPTVHITHVDDKADIPSVPQHVEAKLHEHTGLFPITTKRLALRTQLSKDTLKTIFSVGSLEAHNVDTQPPVPALAAAGDAGLAAEPRHPNRRHTFQAVPSSLAHAAAAVMPLKKAITRKPVPNRKETNGKEHAKFEASASSPDNILDIEAELTTYNSINSSLGNNPYDAAFMAMNDERNAYFSPAGRSMSLTSQLERNLDLRTATSETSPLSPSLPSPYFAELFPPKKTKTPPPVAMATQRRPSSLRVPPPLRPQSTPPTAQSLSRKSSRDSVQGHPVHYQQAGGPGREARGGAASPPAIPPMHPRRSMNLRDPSSPVSPPNRAPNWEVQTNHGSSRRNSFDQGGSSSASSRSQMSPGCYGSQGPAGAPPLRHRASYDGYSNGPRQPWGGHTQPSSGRAKRPADPWGNPAGGPTGGQQLDQYGRYPPYVARGGHYRNRSMGSRSGYPTQPPYRVLHSYNSPAYRGVPIWG